MKANAIWANGLAVAACLLVAVSTTTAADDQDKASQEATDRATDNTTKEATKVITDGSQVSIEYTLNLDDGSTVDSNVGKEPLVYSQGAGQILPALEKALAGLAVNDTKHVELAAADGYGEVDPEAFRDVDPQQIPEDARKVGAMLMAGGPGGPQQPIRVHEVHDDKIVLDFNHPLAGKDLSFDVKIVAIE